MHEPAPGIVFTDSLLVVVDKPSGVPSVPARTPLDPPDVATRLAATHGPLEAVHRLDRDTSGLLVLARTSETRAALGRAFERGDVAKIYLAIVAGRPPQPAGELHLPLAADFEAWPRRGDARRTHSAHRPLPPAPGSPRLARLSDSRRPVVRSRSRAGRSAGPARSSTRLRPSRLGRSHQARVTAAAAGPVDMVS